MQAGKGVARVGLWDCYDARDDLLHKALDLRKGHREKDTGGRQMQTLYIHLHRLSSTTLRIVAVYNIVL